METHAPPGARLPGPPGVLQAGSDGVATRKIRIQAGPDAPPVKDR